MGEEALAVARQEDKPIFLSIGYAACHWCHVMAHESFEDPSIASILNEHFVNIKVDRRNAGFGRYLHECRCSDDRSWWLADECFLTPEGMPFYAGTYFPNPRYNMPAFSDVLIGVAKAWKDNRSAINKTGDQ
jgi:uncharacterized protein YyaL (SSP411 family)